MPRKSKNAKSKRKRKSRASHVINLSSGQSHGVAPLAKIKFPFEASYTLGDGTTTSDQAVQLYANSAFDFYAAVGTNQPPWYDCFVNSTTWIRNRVLGINTDFTFINLSSTAARVAVYITDAAVDMSDLANYQLNNDRMVHSAILTPSGGSKDQVRFRKYFNLVKLFGKKVLMDDNYKHAYNGNPTDIIYLYFMAQSLDGTNTCKVICEMSGVQHCRLEDQSVAVNHEEN